jgi:tRNA(Ile)-lysidine synthase
VDRDLIPGSAAVWDNRYEITTSEPGWTVTAAAGRLSQLSDSDCRIAAAVPAWARGALPVLLRDGGDGPVLAWRNAEVRALAPRRLTLFLQTMSDEMTQEADLFRSIHSETPPADLFSHNDHHRGLG